MPYYSDKGLPLFKSCLRKIQSNCVQNRSIRFKTKYDVSKIEFYCNTKDKRAVLSDSSVVYDFSCPRCGVNYICKMERTLYERTVERAWTAKNSAVYKHLGHWTGVQHLLDIVSLHSLLFRSSAPIQNSDKFDLRITRINLIKDNTEIIDRHTNWNIRLFKSVLN